MAEITVSFMRDVWSQMQREEITYSRMVELLNEKAQEPSPDGVWAGGPVKCDLCGKEWIAVRLADAPQLECPNCENMVNYTVPE